MAEPLIIRSQWKILVRFESMCRNHFCLYGTTVNHPISMKNSCPGSNPLCSNHFCLDGRASKNNFRCEIRPSNGSPFSVPRLRASAGKPSIIYNPNLHILFECLQKEHELLDGGGPAPSDRSLLHYRFLYFFAFRNLRFNFLNSKKHL